MKPAPVKSSVSIEALEQLDIRVGTILSVEDVPGSRKLVRFTVDFGDHTRAILSGLKGERKSLQELVGRQTLFVVDLEPRRMAGLTSEGLLLDLGFADGIAPALAIPEHPIPNGTRAGWLLLPSRLPLTPRPRLRPDKFPNYRKRAGDSIPSLCLSPSCHLARPTPFFRTSN